MILWISIWIYKSLEHRAWKWLPERAQRASLTSSVYSYLRSILTEVGAPAGACFYSYDDLTNHLLFFLFHLFERFHCWYYGISIWIYKSLGHRLRNLPLFHLPSILTLCSFASLFRLLRRSILTAVMLHIRFLFFISAHYLYYHLSCAFSIGDRKWPI